VAPVNNLPHYCFHCNPAGVRLELRNGADPNWADECGVTPLMRVAEMYDAEHYRERKRMFRYLITAGADITAKDSAGRTVWDYARTCSARRFRAFVQMEFRRLTKA
jgi:ankyrin repeat protein